MSAVTDLTRYVWSHPANHGQRGRALARLAAWQLWERLARRPWDIRVVGGYRLRCYPHATASSAVLYCRLPEWTDMCFVRAALRPHDVFVDVGANVGVYTLLAAGTPDVEVWAFEPSSESWPRLSENIGLNHLADRVHAVRSAVGDAERSVSVSVGGDTTNRVLGACTTVGGETVNMSTLDQLLSSTIRPRVRLIKVDVEGLEPEVLQGARAVLAESAPALIVEANDPLAIRAAVGDLGYHPFAYDPERATLEAVDWPTTQEGNMLLLTNPAAFDLAGSAGPG